MDTMNTFALSRNFWDFAFENTGKIKPVHVAIYFFAMEHCNRLGWKKNFGLPTSMVLEAISVKSYSVYKKAFDDLIEFGFFEIIQYSRNQYSSNIIAFKENYKANYKANLKALDKALIKHIAKQTESTLQSTVQSTGQSTVSINKQETIKQETINKEQSIIENYVSEFNKIRNTKFRTLPEKTISVLKNTLKKYSLDEIIQAYKNALKAKHHIESNFQYLTPEFFTRIDKIEMYLNFEEVKPLMKQA